jgi:hypothetical protein
MIDGGAVSPAAAPASETFEGQTENMRFGEGLHAEVKVLSRPQLLAAVAFPRHLAAEATARPHTQKA